ncbi:MAG: GNAT family protein [Erythrobacter sp.]
MPDFAHLYAVLERAPVRLEPFEDHHVEPFRAVCARDSDIWEIYPVNLGGDGFDAALTMFRTLNEWVNFAVIDTRTDALVGMTNFIRPKLHNVVEVGGTFIEPSVRGTGFNRSMKKLIIEHAFAIGFKTVEFRVDTRNKRSMAAVLKLGAEHTETLPKQMVTWTGYERDTAVFALKPDQWAG